MALGTNPKRKLPRKTQPTIVERLAMKLRRHLADAGVKPLSPGTCAGCVLEVMKHAYGDSDLVCLHPDSADDYAPERGKCGLFVRPLLPPKPVSKPAAPE